MNKKNKLVLIKERYDLKPIKDSGDNVIRLEAPVAVFGKKNDNGRIYEESNYLPLLEELQQKIKLNSLTGELDHPGERLEVYLDKASHKIEEIKYDKNSRTVNAKIRLIEGTVSGNNAIALHNAGVTLGISSRAIGVIKESKALLKKIITFDVVSTPGFNEALLQPIHESIDFVSNADEYGIYEITDEKYLKLYESFLEEEVNNTNINKENSMDEIKKLYETINALKDDLSNINKKIDAFSEYNEKHVNDLNVFADSFITNVTEMENFKEKFSSYNEAETEKLHFLKDKVDIIDEAMNMFLTSYESYSEKETEKLNALVEHQEIETDKINTLVSFIDKQMNTLNEMVEHNHKESDKLNHFVNWTEEKVKDLYENADFKTFINKQNTAQIDLKNISESVNNVLDNVRKQKTFKDAVLNKYKFLQNLSENKQQEFLNLDETRKTMILKKINEGSLTNESEIINAWDNTLKEMNENSAIWLVNASEDHKKLWITLNESEKTEIIRSAEMRNFRTSEDVNNFWNGLNLNRKLELIKENQNLEDFDVEKEINTVKKVSNDYRLGYSQNYIDSVKDAIRKNKF